MTAEHIFYAYVILGSVYMFLSAYTNPLEEADFEENPLLVLTAALTLIILWPIWMFLSILKWVTKKGKERKDV